MSHTRKMYVYNTKIIDEQVVRKQALRMIQNGTENVVEIHKHTINESCAFDGVVDIALQSEVVGLDPDECYKFTKETA